MVCGCLPIVRGLFPAHRLTRRKSDLDKARLVGYTHSRSPKGFQDSPGYIRMDDRIGHAPSSTTVKSGSHVAGDIEESGDGILVRTRVEVV